MHGFTVICHDFLSLCCFSISCLNMCGRGHFLAQPCFMFIMKSFLIIDMLSTHNLLSYSVPMTLLGFFNQIAPGTKSPFRTFIFVVLLHLKNLKDEANSTH